MSAAGVPISGCARSVVWPSTATFATASGYPITRYQTLLNSPGVYAGIVLVLGITGLHEPLLRRLERKVAAYRQGE
jgi:ABC-type nitrate/sulfonate/bicarbonate transport system permease component